MFLLEIDKNRRGHNKYFLIFDSHYHMLVGLQQICSLLKWNSATIIIFTALNSIENCIIVFVNMMFLLLQRDNFETK